MTGEHKATTPVLRNDWLDVVTTLLKLRLEPNSKLPPVTTGIAFLILSEFNREQV